MMSAENRRALPLSGLPDDRGLRPQQGRSARRGGDRVPPDRLDGLRRGQGPQRRSRSRGRATPARPRVRGRLVPEGRQGPRTERRRRDRSRRDARARSRLARARQEQGRQDLARRAGARAGRDDRRLPAAVPRDVRPDRPEVASSTAPTGSATPTCSAGSTRTRTGSSRSPSSTATRARSSTRFRCASTSSPATTSTAIRRCRAASLPAPDSMFHRMDQNRDGFVTSADR